MRVAHIWYPPAVIQCLSETRPATRQDTSPELALVNQKKKKKPKKQEAHWPWLAHLSEIATEDMEMLSNIFPILSLQLMKGSSFEQFLVLKKKNVVFLLSLFYHTFMGMTVNGAWPFEQTLNPISTVGST